MADLLIYGLGILAMVALIMEAIVPNPDRDRIDEWKRRTGRKGGRE